MIHLVLLSGGSGSRLWPLSNSARSKQFLKVLRDGHGNHVSMVQRVFDQIGKVEAEVDITIATCVNQENSIRSQVQGKYELVLEPERRDTAPAIMLACAHLAYERKVCPEDTVVVMPIDSYADDEFYEKIRDLEHVVQESEGLALLGVEPTYPSEKYGYIIPSNHTKGQVWRVKEFKEKPTEGAAREYIKQGALWNCGIFAFKLKYLIEILEGYNSSKDFQDVLDNYSKFPKISFDYEIVEKAASVAVVLYAGIWKDLGTWNTLTDEMADKTSGRVVVDKSTCENVHVVNETGLPLIIAGLKDSVVVATPDGILVSSKEASAGIKDQIAEAAQSRPMYEQRHWGEYRVIDSNIFPGGSKVLAKELIVKSGKQLSYQRHQHRSEIWTIVSGTGEIVIDDLVRQVSAGSVVNIEAGRMHAAFAVDELHVIEVQLGDVLVEEDIERYGNFWESPQ